MVGKLEKARGNTPPMLDLETLNSDVVVPDIDGSTEEVWPSTSWKSFVGWTLAAVTAIVVGVIPALWINRWRAEASEPPPSARELTPVVTPSSHVQVEPIEPAPAKAEPAPAVALEREPEPAAAVPAKVTVKKPLRRKAVKQPAARPPKKTPPPPPPCDIYLHPHGCPR